MEFHKFQDAFDKLNKKYHDNNVFAQKESDRKSSLLSDQQVIIESLQQKLLQTDQIRIRQEITIKSNDKLNKKLIEVQKELQHSNDKCSTLEINFSRLKKENENDFLKFQTDLEALVKLKEELKYNLEGLNKSVIWISNELSSILKLPVPSTVKEIESYRADLRAIARSIFRTINERNSEFNLIHSTSEFKIIVEFICNIINKMIAFEEETSILSNELEKSTEIIDTAQTMLYSLEEKVKTNKMEMNNNDQIVHNININLKELLITLSESINSSKHQPSSTFQSSILRNIFSPLSIRNVAGNSNSIDIEPLNGGYDDYIHENANLNSSNDQALYRNNSPNSNEINNKINLSSDSSLYNMSKLEANVEILTKRINSLLDELDILRQDDINNKNIIDDLKLKSEEDKNQYEIQIKEIIKVHEFELKNSWEGYRNEIFTINKEHENEMELVEAAALQAQTDNVSISDKFESEYSEKLQGFSINLAESELELEICQGKVRDYSNILENLVSYTLFIQNKNEELTFQKKFMSKMIRSFNSLIKDVNLLFIGCINSGNDDKKIKEFNPIQFSLFKPSNNRHYIPSLRVVTIFILAGLRMKRILKSIRSKQYGVQNLPKVYYNKDEVDDNIEKNKSYWILPSRTEILHLSSDKISKIILNAAENKENINGNISNDSSLLQILSKYNLKQHVEYDISSSNNNINNKLRPIWYKV
jgi:hypothetical protein